MSELDEVTAEIKAREQVLKDKEGWQRVDVSGEPLTDDEQLKIIDLLITKTRKKRPAKLDRTYADFWLKQWGASLDTAGNGYMTVPSMGKMLDSGIVQAGANLGGYDDTLTYYRTMIYTVSTWEAEQIKTDRDLLEWEYVEYAKDAAQTWSKKTGLSLSRYRGRKHELQNMLVRRLQES